MRLQEGLDAAKPMRQQITRIRKARNLTQTELAKLCGLSRQSINMFECDNNYPSLPNAYRLARSLGVTIDALYLAEGAELPALDILFGITETEATEEGPELEAARDAPETSEEAAYAEKQHAAARQHD